jgi:valyl-tRNA synthetase
VHRQSWPEPQELAVAEGADPQLLDAVAAALAGLRGVKSGAKVSMRTELRSAAVAGPSPVVALAREGADDLRAAGKVTGELTFTEDEGSELRVTAEIAD